MEVAAKEAEEWGYHCLAFGFQGWMEARLGQFEKAASSMRQHHKLLDEKFGGHFILADWIVVGRAELAFSMGQVQEAIDWAAQAATMAHAYGGIFPEGLARQVWGQALATHEQFDESESQLAESLRLFDLGQARLEAARTHAAWGTVCRERGNLAAARQHWEQTAAQFEKSGLARELEQTRELMATLPVQKQ